MRLSQKGLKLGNSFTVLGADEIVLFTESVKQTVRQDREPEVLRRSY